MNIKTTPPNNKHTPNTYTDTNTNATTNNKAGDQTIFTCGNNTNTGNSKKDTTTMNTNTYHV